MTESGIDLAFDKFVEDMELDGNYYELQSKPITDM